MIKSILNSILVASVFILMIPVHILMEIVRLLNPKVKAGKKR